MREALYYNKEAGYKAHCRLCPHECVIANGKRGRCGVRVNEDGTLYTEIYGKTTSVALDPVEKKPLYHFHPGEFILSLGTKGCNFSCPWCQNWRISQDRDVPTDEINISLVVEKARALRSFGIAYTYNEPFIWYEFVLDCCKAAHEAGLKNVFVSNGYVNPEPLDEILPFLDAANIDIKSINDDFYRKYCGAELRPVLDTAAAIKSKAHVEITNLIIPTLNDSEDDIARLVDWVADNLGADTPMHFSRYFPCYKTDLPPTPAATLEAAGKIAGKRLKHVHLGNI